MARRIRTRSVISFGLLAILAVSGCSPSPAHDGPPNVVLIVGDDHGWPYFGFMGDPIVETPHLDALAREGVVFPYGYATASTCQPSLRSLLTGLDPEQWNARRRALRAERKKSADHEPIRDFATLPGLLGTQGYASLQTGKYWEATFQAAGFTHGMKDPDEIVRPGEPGWIQISAGGSGLAIGRSTMQPLWDFLEQVGDQRFFVWFAPSLPHTPHDPPQEFLDRYAGVELSDAARAYYANITRFDARVGELVAHLEALGIRDETLLVYLSDNGWDQPPDARNPVPSLGGTRGKSSMYELGFRTPIIFQWPGKIPGGRTRNELVSEVDLFTTLLDFAGLKAPPDRTGINLRPALLRDEPPLRTTVIGSMSSLRPPPEVEASPDQPARKLVRFERAYFLRNASWRYIWYAQSDRFEDRSVDELYRIDRDPLEEHDVVAEHPDLAKKFRLEIERWIEETRALTKAST